MSFAGKDKNYSGDSIQVYIRIRPPADQFDGNICLNATSFTSLSIRSTQNSSAKDFTFDYVAGQNVDQKNVFDTVGRKIVEGCIEGYNGTIFAYGQTGSGKTYTMLGPSENFSTECSRELRGVIPRALEYLFQLIQRKIDLHGDQVEFLCKCSFLEIYNEQIYDLLDLDPTSSLQLRESLKNGVFVDGKKEIMVSNATKAYQVLQQGWDHRHVAATSMNRESSRSHAVFTVSIESEDKTGEITKVRQSLLNLVDLAGSERQRDTGASGARLKEAGSINKSLSVLGNVIMSLVDIGNGKSRHVPYRDSKLTFLLRDSVGGNARTCIIANVHPNSSCCGETLSTLYFAQRAKMIKNKARVNEDAHGDIVALQNEIRRLKFMLTQSQTSVGAKTQPQDDGDYKQWFLQAMELWKLHTRETDRISAKVTSLKSTIAKNEKALMSARMIIKFRDSAIERLRGKPKAGEDDNNNNNEIGLLKKEIKVLNDQIQNHPQVAVLIHEKLKLERDVEHLKSMPTIEGFLQFTVSRKTKLLEEYERLVKENPHITEVLPSQPRPQNDGRIKALEEELANAKKHHKDEVTSLNEKLLRAETELAATRSEKLELEKMLQSSQDDARMQIKQLNSTYNSTLRTLTTPQKKDQGFKRPGSGAKCPSARKLLKSSSKDSVFSVLDASLDGSFNLQSDVLDIQDEMSNIALKFELESERESKTKFEEQVVGLERECSQLKQQLAAMAVTDQREENEAVIDKLQQDSEKHKDAIKKLKFENQIQREEIEDLKIMMKSADRELSEKKSLLLNSQKEMQNRLETLRSSLQQSQDELKSKTTTVEELTVRAEQHETEVLALTADNDFMREQMTSSNSKLRECEETIAQFRVELERAQEQLKVSHKALESKLENENRELRRKMTTSIEEANAERDKVAKLESKLESEEKISKNNKVAMSALLQQVNELRGAMTFQDISSEQLRTELKESKENACALAQEVETYKTRGEKYTRELEHLRETFELEISKRQFEVDNLQDDLSGLTEHYGRLESEMQEKDVRIKSAEEQHQKTREEVAQLKIQLQSQKQFADQLQQDHTNFALQVAQDKEKTDEDHVTETQALRRDAEQEKTKCEKLKEELSEVCEKLRAHEDNIASRASDIERMNKLSEECETLRSELQKERSLRENAEQSLNELSSENAKLAGHTNHLQKIHYLQKIRSELADITNERNQLKQKCERQSELLRHTEKQSTVKKSRFSCSPARSNPS